MNTYRERLTQFLEIPRVLVFAYVTQSIFDSGLDHVICFVQWGVSMQPEA